MRSLQLLLLAFASLSLPLAAQLEIATVHGTLPYTDYGAKVVGIGDGDGDGVPDFLVHSRITGSPGSGRLQLMSGATRTQLGVATYPSWHFGALVVSGTGDLDGDGHNDFVAGLTSTLRAYSGATGALIWTSSALADFYCVCGVADVDNDGLADVVAGVEINNDDYLILLRGSDGSQFGAGGLLQNQPREVVSLGDVNGDGTDDVAVRTSSQVKVYKTPLSLLSTINIPTGSLVHVEAADVAGDARNEVIISRQSTIHMCSPLTGQQLWAFDGIGNQFTVVGDLNGDGFDDLALEDGQPRYGFTPNGSLIFIAGTTGEMLANWSYTPQFRMEVMTGVGDIDGDGVSDLLLGDDIASSTGGSGDGGFQLVSGRILATTHSIPVQCGGGPFPPELGVTRPIIGQSSTVIGRDCPANAWGVLAYSQRPEHPVSLGFSGCDVWFDVNNWLVAHLQPPSATWSHGLAIPNVPQLAGLSIALQSFYLPTNSPIGLDLSNAIWARVGF